MPTDEASDEDRATSTPSTRVTRGEDQGTIADAAASPRRAAGSIGAREHARTGMPRETHRRTTSPPVRPDAPRTTTGEVEGLPGASRASAALALGRERAERRRGAVGRGPRSAREGRGRARGAERAGASARMVAQSASDATRRARNLNLSESARRVDDQPVGN